MQDKILETLKSRYKRNADGTLITMKWADLDLEDKDAENISQLISAKTVYEENVIVDLSQNNIGSKGIQIIFHTLENCSFRKDLHILLFSNVFKKAGLNTVMRYLNSENSPEHYVSVDLGGNFLDFDDAKIIASHLRNSKFRKKLELDLSENQIGDKGAKILLEALDEQSLLEIDLHENDLTGKCEKFIKDWLKGKKNIKIKFDESPNPLIEQSNKKSEFLENISIEPGVNNFYNPLFTLQKQPLSLPIYQTEEKDRIPSDFTPQRP